MNLAEKEPKKIIRRRVLKVTKSETFKFRMKSSLKEDLKRYSEKNNVPMSEVISLALNEYL